MMLITFLVGEEEELKGLLLGSTDLEKKLLKAVEETKRLKDKTERLINRNRKYFNNDIFR